MDRQGSYWAELKGMRGRKKGNWLFEKQQEVVEYWQKHGTQGALLKFRIKQRDVLEKVLKGAGVKLEPSWQYYRGVASTRIPRHSADLAQLERPVNLTGGKKAKWLRLHKLDVVRFYEDNDKDFTKTCFHFRLSGPKLKQFLKDTYRSMGLPVPEINEDVEMLREAVILQAATIAELRGEVKQLAEDYRNFVPEVTKGLERVVGQFLQSLAMQQGAQAPTLPEPQQPQLPEPKPSIDVVEEAEAIAAHSWVDEEEELYRIGLEWFKSAHEAHQESITEERCLELWGREEIIAEGLRQRELRKLGAIIDRAVREADWRTAFWMLRHEQAMPFPLLDRNIERFKEEWDRWVQEGKRFFGALLE